MGCGRLCLSMPGKIGAVDRSCSTPVGLEVPENLVLTGRHGKGTGRTRQETQRSAGIPTGVLCGLHCFVHICHCRSSADLDAM